MKNALGLLLVFAFAGCSPTPDASETQTEAEEPQLGNRIAIPASVRGNLGLTFARVESRPVATTLHFPGRLALVPGARVEHTAHLAGRVEMLVRQFDEVAVGTELLRISSPDWSERQQHLAALHSRITQEETQLRGSAVSVTAAESVTAALESGIAAWSERLTDLEEVRAAGGGGAELISEARAALADARSGAAQSRRDVVESTTRVELARVALDAARLEYATEIAGAAVATGLSVDELTALDADGRPAWSALAHVSVRAATAGVVSEVHVASGAWIDTGAAAITVLDTRRLRFEARASQSDLGALASGLVCSIVPPRVTLDARSIPYDEVMTGALVLGPEARSSDNTVELFCVPTDLTDWARPGVGARLEVYTSATSGDVLAVPRAALQRDGLETVFFRRDPSDPDRAMRVVADVGVADERWIEVRSGIREGDEVVLDGGYQLMLATSGSASKGGHFHADGTFHEGED